MKDYKLLCSAQYLHGILSGFLPDSILPQSFTIRVTKWLCEWSEFSYKLKYQLIFLWRAPATLHWECASFLWEESTSGRCGWDTTVELPRG